MKTVLFPHKLPIGRRQFIRWSAASLALTAAPRLFPYLPSAFDSIATWDMSRFTMLTDGFKKRPWNEVFAMMVEAGFPQVEIRAMAPQFSMNPSPEIVTSVLELATRAGCRITGLNAYLGPRGGEDPTDVSAQIAAGQRNIDAAARFGARLCRVLPRRERTKQSYWDLLPFLRGLLPYAGARRVSLVVETRSGVDLDVTTMSEFCRAVDSPWFGLVFNPVQFADGGKDYKEAWAGLRGHVVHLHLRDYRRAAGGELDWAELGEGEMDLAWMIRELRNTKYSGLIGLEFDKAEPTVAAMKQWHQCCQRLLAATA